MARFDDLLGEARIGLAQAPDISIIGALRRATARFCRETMLWRADLDPLTLRTGVGAYDIEGDNGARVEQLLTVKVDGVPLKDGAIIRVQDLRALQSAAGAPVAAALSVDGTQLLLWRTPTAAENGKRVDVFAALSVPRSATELPDFLADDWHDAIVAGAQAEMYGNKAMPWYDDRKAQERGDKFADDVVRAKRKQHSGGHARMQVRMNPWR